MPSRRAGHDRHGHRLFRRVSDRRGGAMIPSPAPPPRRDRRRRDGRARSVRDGRRRHHYHHVPPSFTWTPCGRRPHSAPELTVVVESDRDEQEEHTMAWDFETEPEYQEKLDWVDAFVRRGGRAARPRAGNPYDKSDPRVDRADQPLQQQVRDQGLWACHLGPELGGPGYGQVKLALLNEILGRGPGRRRSSAARRPTRATPRSSPTTAPRSRRRSTSSRCSTARSRRATR